MQPTIRNGAKKLYWLIWKNVDNIEYSDKKTGNKIIFLGPTSWLTQNTIEKQSSNVKHLSLFLLKN